MVNKQFEMPVYLTSNDVDLNGYGKASAYLRYMQEVGIYQMLRDLPSDDELRDRGQAFMVTRLDIKIYNHAPRGVELVGSSWACEGRRATFKRGYSISHGEMKIAEAYSQWTLVDLKDRKILKVENVDLSNYYMGEYKEFFDDKFKINPDEISLMDFVDTRKIYLRDIDRNGHMNNTYYLDMFFDYIPELIEGKSEVSAIRLHFAREAKLNENLKIKMGKRENSYIFQAINEDDLLNAEAEIYL